MVDERMYDEWIAQRRSAEPTRELVERVMFAIKEQDMQRNPVVCLSDRINESRPARWVACLAALLIGCLPFFVVAYVAQSLVY